MERGCVASGFTERYTGVVRYELWHVGSANLMDDFEGEAEALVV